MPGNAQKGRAVASRRTWLAIALGAVLTTIFGLFACSGSSSDSVRPTTGILIRAETLTTGRGCGKNPTQLFKYAVVVFGYNGTGDQTTRANYTSPVTANVFDCFTDGAFIELPQVNGNSSFRLEVFAYNEPAYNAFRTSIEQAGTDTSRLKTTTPTWTTECTASQQQDVQTLALCDPLGAGVSGLGGLVPATKITFGTGTFHLADGRTATCANGTDAGAEDANASSDGASDANDGSLLVLDASLDINIADADGGASDASGTASQDAGPPITFTTARIRYRTPSSVGSTVDLTCPGTYVADVPSEPAHYEIDVGLLDSSGAVVGQTVCTVTSQTGATSSAICP